MTKKIQVGFSIIIILVTSILSSCSNKISYNLVINTEKIEDYMKYQQCDDGGFADTISLSVIDYNDFYDTYCSLYILELCDYKLSEDQYTKAIGFLKKINMKELINNGDKLDKVFFYLRISDFLQYKIPDDELKIAYDYISQLQLKEGLFAPSNSDKEAINKGDLKIDSLIGVDLFTIANIIELSQTRNIKIDQLGVINYLKEFTLNKSIQDSDQSDLIQVSAFALMIKARLLWHDFEDSIDLTAAKELYEKDIKTVVENENNYDIGLVYNLLTIGNYLNLNDTELLKLILSKYYNKNGFSPYISTDNHIMATRNALLAYKELSVDLDKDQKESIINNVLNNQFYDGRFVVGRKETAYADRILDTYNAVLLLNELGNLKPYKADINKFYQTKVEEKKLEEYSLYDKFYLLSIAIYCDIQINKKDMDQFINEFCIYLEESKSIDYQFVIAVIETFNYYGVDYSKDTKNKLIKSAEDDNDKTNYITEFMRIYYKYVVYKTCGVEYSSVYEDAITYYNKNYNKLEYKIFPAKYIARIIRYEQLPLDKLSNRKELAQEIDKCTDGILFGYVDDMPATFDSTESVIEIIKSLDLDK